MTLFIALFKEYWKAALILVIAAFFFIQYHIIKSQRDHALQAITEMQQETLKQSARVQLLTEQGKRDTGALQATYNEIVTYLLKGKSDDKKTIGNLRASLDGKLLKQSESYNSTVPNNDANRPSGDDSNTNVAYQGKQAEIVDETSENFYKAAYMGTREYIETLEKAGAVCAADYNVCKAYVDQEQKRIGVYSE